MQRLDGLLKRSSSATAYKSHRIEFAPLGVNSFSIDGNNPWMLKLCRQLNLRFEPFLRIGIESLIFTDLFDRHLAGAFMVYPLKDFPHPPTSDQLEF
jgi:hypothetical protein